MKTYAVRTDHDNGCFLLLEDGRGLARSKSRNVLKRIRDALEAPNGLIGKRVEEDESVFGVVLAVSQGSLIVRLPNDELRLWPVSDCRCRIVEPEAVDGPTTDDEPAIGVHAATALLQRVHLAADGAYYRPHTPHFAGVLDEVAAFLQARRDAEPT